MSQSSFQSSSQPSHRKCWAILPVYLVPGLCLGLADTQLGLLVQQIGLRPGWATAISVNIFLPLVAIGLAVARPLFRTVCMGALAMTLAYILGLSHVHPPAGPPGPLALIAAVPPVLVLACVGYAVIGMVTVLVSRSLAGDHARNISP